MSSEYNGNSNSAGCTYKSLCNYNTRKMGLYSAGVPDMSTQIVPDWPYGPDYQALTHGGVSNGCGYFNIKDAYGYKCKTPIPYRKRPCASGCPGDISGGGVIQVPTTRQEKLKFAKKLVDTFLTGAKSVAKGCVANYIVDIWEDEDWRMAMVASQGDLAGAVQAAAGYSGCVKM